MVTHWAAADVAGSPAELLALYAQSHLRSSNTTQQVINRGRSMLVSDPEKHSDRCDGQDVCQDRHEA